MTNSQRDEIARMVEKAWRDDQMRQQMAATEIRNNVNRNTHFDTFNEQRSAHNA